MKKKLIIVVTLLCAGSNQALAEKPRINATSERKITDAGTPLSARNQRAVVTNLDSPILHRNVEYGQAGGEKLLLDVREPHGDGPFPVAIYVHGGGWTGGDKANPDDAPALDLFAKAGFTWFSINYRLAPQHRWPACINDVQTAIRWVKANAARYKGDPSRIVLAGYSAGGHLAIYASTVIDDSVRVQAVVGFAPLTDFVQELPKRGNILGRAQRGLLNRPQELTPESLGMLKALSPINYLRPGLPPFLFIHGDVDGSVPYEQSFACQAKLRGFDVRCDVITVPGAPHRLTQWKQHLPDYDSRAIAWLHEILGCQVDFSSGVVMAKDEGLIHRYKFDGDLKDAVGNAHGKILKGAGTTAIYIEGRDGTQNGAISFPVPPNDWYVVNVGTWSPSQEGNKDEMTITFWAYWRGGTGSPPKYQPQDIINKRDSYKANDMVWGINQHGFTGHVLSVQRDKKVYANSSKGIPVDKWTHVAVSLDGKKAYFYLDGEPYDSQDYTYGSDFEAMIRIGNSANNGKANIKDVFNGALDDVCFYSRKLTDEEIKTVFSPSASATTSNKTNSDAN